MTAYRVWYIVNPPARPTYRKVESPETGAALIDSIAEKQLRNSRIYANVFGLQVKEGDEWVEWEDENGYDIEAFAEAKP